MSDLKLTDEVLAPYQGGQMEIQNPDDEYLCRGEIESIRMEDNFLKVRFAWLGTAGVYNPDPTRWWNMLDLDYEANLDMYAVSVIGPGSHETDGTAWLNLYSPGAGETLMIFPPSSTNKLDRAKVEGLATAT